MRTGAYTVHQTLTPEAASVLKQSLTLARRRGHSQVTPLHVASTLLTSTRSNLFRRACLKSHPFTSLGRQMAHPSLHCRALELCFNVALNRLPTNPNPLFQTQPSLSNALVAALKRAQAHQRRGCVEQQQSQQNQPFLAVKVELEQLVVSILDDPSVSRVMREAGLSSVSVKGNIDDDSSVVSPVFYGSSSSVGVFSSPCSPTSSENNQGGGTLSPNPSKIWHGHLTNHHSFEQNPFFHFPKGKTFAPDHVREDANPVIEVLLGKKNNKKRNTVIVGDSVSLTEGVVAKLMGRIERGEVPDDLKQTHFIKFQFSQVGLNFMKKEDIEGQVRELKRKVDSFTSWSSKGVIVCLGDLNWAVWSGENSASSSQYSAADHLVEEIGRLVYEYSNSGAKVWLLGTASYQTYMRCQMKQPPLDVQWALQAVSIPSGELSLTLHASSGHSSEMAPQVMEMKPFRVKEEGSGQEEEDDKLNFCGECAFNYEKEAKAFISAQHKILPPWLQPHGDNNNINQKFQDELSGLRKKWNRFCLALHHMKPGMTTQSFGWRAEQSSSAFVDSSGVKQNSRASSSVAKFRRQNSCTIEFSFGTNNQEGLKKNLTDELSLDGFKISNDEGVEAKITLALGHSPFPSDDEEEPERSTTMRGLSEKLQENIPWQRGVLPSVVEAMEEFVKRSTRRDTWMLLSGNDVSAKRRLALTVTTSLFGSVDNMLKINLKTSKASEAYEELEKALKNGEKVVVLIEGVDLADDRFMELLVDRVEAGKSGDLDDSQGKKSHMIFLLTREDDECEDNEHVVIPMVLKCKKLSSGLVNNKRKPESDAVSTMVKMKNPRIQEEEDVACDISNIKKEFSRQLSFGSNALDLNLRVDTEEQEEEAAAKSATQERFLDSIKNRFDFTVLSNEDITKFFVTKIKDSCEEILGQHEERFGFTVEPELIEKFYRGCGFFANGSFEEWVKDVFQTGLVTVKNGGKEGISVINLCLRGIDMIDQGEVYEEEGFMGTCLPGKIRLQLTKPVTWPPLVWGVVCGAAASGNFHWTPEDVAKSILCMMMSGPCLTGYTQTINDWYDREIDAINEPYRPIPSGAISEQEVITQVWVLLLGGLGIAGVLDVWAGHTTPTLFYLALGGSLLSYIYSAPPLKLKQNGWVGNFALGASYISLPWWAGQALFGTLTPDVVVLTLLYSIAGLGIAIVNDFKSVEGDRAMGLQSLPVAFGTEAAKWICVSAIDVTQLSVAGYLLASGKPYYALALLALIIPQIVFQFKYFLKDPVKYDVKYQASAQPFLVLGIFVTALASSH